MAGLALEWLALPMGDRESQQDCTPGEAVTRKLEVECGCLLEMMPVELLRSHNRYPQFRLMLHVPAMLLGYASHIKEELPRFVLANRGRRIGQLDVLRIGFHNHRESDTRILGITNVSRDPKGAHSH